MGVVSTLQISVKTLKPLVTNGEWGVLLKIAKFSLISLIFSACHLLVTFTEQELNA